MPTLEAGSIDAIITDLPYGTTACKWDVIIPFVPMWEQVKRLLKQRGAFVTTASQPFTSALVMSNVKMFRDEWVWDKVNGSNFGNVKKHPFKTHENIIVFSDKPIETYNPIYREVSKRFGKESFCNSDVTASVTKTRNQGVGYPSSIITNMRPNNLTGGGHHPTQKPVALYEYLIKTYTNEGDTVLDFVMGSGTTGIACKNTGRNFIGIEKDDKYFKIAEARINDLI
jgi:site-specific DNA-methyltransferase (adenine-specific)